MSGKVLFLLLDAFRGDYINRIDTPFLFEKAQAGIFCDRLTSITGFTQRTAILTGTKGTTSGTFTMFTFDRETSPFRFLASNRRAEVLQRRYKWIVRLRHVPGLRSIRGWLLSRFVDRPRAALVEWIETEVRKRAFHAPIAHIPIELLPDISLSEDQKPIHRPGASHVESLIDVLCEAHIPYDFLLYPVMELDDDGVVEATVQSRESAASIVFAQLSDADSLVHHCGPASEQRRKIVGEIDRKLRQIADAYGDDCTWIVIGDHGMTDVHDEVNVQRISMAAASACGARPRTDYSIFLDSTMARWRWRSPKGEAMAAVLRANPELQRLGSFVDAGMAEQYQIPYADPRYGDLIWWANNGVLVFPDFFHDWATHNKGMHGYRSDHPDMKGFFLAFGPGIQPRLVGEAHLTDVCATLSTAVGVRPPQHCTGTSLL